MPVIMKETVFAAAGTVDNVLTGSAFEFARQNELVSMGLVATAAGAFVTITSGSDVILEESPVPIQATGFPIIPDSMYFSDVAAPGDRLVMKVRATGALTVRSVTQITPL
jgi:hypothetical protein